MKTHRFWTAAWWTSCLLFALGFLSISAFALTNGGFPPGSTAVYYVSNTAGSDTNAGTSASAPLKTLGRAYSLMSSGGTIVICGDVQVASAFAPPDAGGTVLYTSKYGNEDFRSSAKMIISANMAFACDTYFENIKFSIQKSGLIFSGRCHSIGFGAGMTVTNDSGAENFVYPSVIGGYNNPATLTGASTTRSYTVKICSGTWGFVSGGHHRTNGSQPVGNLSGNVSVVIRGGTFMGNNSALNYVSATGMNNHTGRVYLEISGGTFHTPIVPIKRIGTISASAERSVKEYTANVLVRITGGTFNHRFRLAQQTAAENVGGYQIYSDATVVVTGGTFNADFCGYGVLGSTILKYNEDVLAKEKIKGFPVYRTVTLSVSANPTELTRFENPIGDKADPYVIEKDDVYYYCFSSSENGVPAIKVAAHGSVPFGTLTTQMHTVFTAEDTTIANAKKEYWAPELHYFDAATVGTSAAGWYIYFAADDGNNENHRMYVLRSTDPEDPLSDFRMVGKITDSTNRWAIDGTVFKHGGNLYYVWSGWPGATNGVQNLYIAQMSSPTALSSARVLISAPTYDWEKQGDPDVNEGPQVLQYGGSTHIVYSASGSWTQYYCYGILTLTGSNPLSASSWTKNASPVFQSGNSMYGPGHGTFVIGEDDEWWMIYHANPSLTVPSGSSWWAQRNIYAKKFTFTNKTIGGKVYKFPNFGSPAGATSTQYMQARTAHYHAAGNHMYSPELYIISGSVIEYAKKCYICGEKTVRTAEITQKPVFTASSTANSVTLTWSKIEGVTGYKIYRKAPGETAYTALKAIYDPDAVSYTDTGLTGGETYGYLMHAFYKDNADVVYFSPTSGGQLVNTK